MHFLDAIELLPPGREEFKELLLKDPEFRISFICTNNPSGIIANMRAADLLHDDQQIEDDEVYNYIVALVNKGQRKTVRQLLKVPLVEDGEGMTEAMLEAFIDLEGQYPATNQIYDSKPAAV